MVKCKKHRGYIVVLESIHTMGKVSRTVVQHIQIHNYIQCKEKIQRPQEPKGTRGRQENYIVHSNN